MNARADFSSREPRESREATQSRRTFLKQTGGGLSFVLVFGPAGRHARAPGGRPRGGRHARGGRLARGGRTARGGTRLRGLGQDRDGRPGPHLQPGGGDGSGLHDGPARDHRRRDGRRLGARPHRAFSCRALHLRAQLGRARVRRDDDDGRQHGGARVLHEPAAGRSADTARAAGQRGPRVERVRR